MVGAPQEGNEIINQKKRRSEQINEANDQMTKRASNNKIHSIKYGDVFFKAILVINKILYVRMKRSLSNDHDQH